MRIRRTTANATAAIMRITDVVSTFSLLFCVSLVSKILGEPLDHGDPSRSQSHDEDRGENEKNQGKDQFNGGLRRQFLRLLPPLRTQCVRIDSQSLCNARAEGVRLNQRGGQRAGAVDVDPVGEILQSLFAGTARLLLQVDQQKLVANFGLACLQFPPYAVEHLVQAKAGLRADHHQVERLGQSRSEEHTSELQSLRHLVCRLLLEKK